MLEWKLIHVGKKGGPIVSTIDSWYIMIEYNIDGLVQDCSNSTANALELLQSCTK